MTVVRARPLAERLEEVTAPCPDIDALARAIFDTVAEYVPFAFGCVATTDPASELITRAVKSHPLAIGDDEFAAAEYGAPDVNQFAELARRPVPVGVLSVDTGGHLDTCRRFRDYMAPVFGFTDELRVACRARNTTWGALAFYRGPGEAPFTERDGDLLGSVHELVAQRLQRALFAANPGAHDGAGAAVLIVDADNRVTDMTAAVEARIDELGGWDNGSLPANLVTVTAAARSSRQPARTRVLGTTGRWLAVQAMPLDGADGRRSVVLTVDAASASAIGQMTLAARGLTIREQDVAQLVLHGASTKAIAGTLHLSPHTVQDHLKSIFVKLGVRSRREMIAQLVLDDEPQPRA